MLQMPSAEAAQEVQGPPGQANAQGRPRNPSIQGPQLQLASAQEAKASDGAHLAGMAVMVEVDVGPRGCVVVVHVHLVELILLHESRVLANTNEMRGMSPNALLQSLPPHNRGHRTQLGRDHGQRRLRRALRRARQHRPVVEPPPARNPLNGAERKDGVFGCPIGRQLPLLLLGQNIFHKVHAQLSQQLPPQFTLELGFPQRV
mmetsp:Transcript_84856/g.274280  ORF Transcript_84856/g.274280 Transcript_84856/m.274280 type:complete len:203 (-) Transcript_84856:373-981(-)